MLAKAEPVIQAPLHDLSACSEKAETGTQEESPKLVGELAQWASDCLRSQGPEVDLPEPTLKSRAWYTLIVSGLGR